MNTVFDIAQRRLRAVEQTGLIIKRQAAQIAELKQLRKQWDAELLAGTSDLYGAVTRYEGELIRIALRAANKKVTYAAKLLGVKHQTLAAIIGRRHKELESERSPVYRRKRFS